jgi:hypothetical protein
LEKQKVEGIGREREREREREKERERKRCKMMRKHITSIKKRYNKREQTQREK